MNTSRTRALLVGGATLAPAVIYGISRLAGTDLTVTMSGQPPLQITLPFVVITAVAAALAGWALLATLERFISRARMVWTAVAVVALFASFAMPLTVAAGGAVRITLLLMHVAVGAVLIPGLRSTAADVSLTRSR